MLIALCNHRIDGYFVSDPRKRMRLQRAFPHRRYFAFHQIYRTKLDDRDAPPRHLNTLALNHAIKRLLELSAEEVERQGLHDF